MSMRKHRLAWIMAPLLVAAAPIPNASQQLTSAVDAYSDHVISREPASAALLGRLPGRVPSLDRADLEAEAKFNRDLRAKVEKIDPASLTVEEQLSLGALLWLLKAGEQAPKDYDFTFPAPYTLSQISWLAPTFAGPLATAAQRSAYVDLLDSVGVQLSTIRTRLADQRAKGILMPKRQVPRGIASLEGMKPLITAWGNVDRSRLTGASQQEQDAFLAATGAKAQAALAAADQLIAALGPDYLAAAPDRVGLAQYPGGREYYRYLVNKTATFDTTPEALRELGQRMLDENNRQLEALAQKLGVPGGRAGLRAYVNSNPRFIPKTPADVEAKYRSCLARIEPKVASLFPMPAAPYGIRRLEPAAEKGLTFGYYDPPTAARPVGEYNFNGSDLQSRPMISSCALIFHELIPGHHLHLALQIENKNIPDFRRTAGAFFAFNEGWGEYASNEARELGGYEDPADLAGRLMLNSMDYARLVIDVGLNYDGWTYDQAAQFMRNNLYFSDKEIESEVLRYGADLPSQALAYGSGVTTFQRLRAEARERQGAKFDLAAFHREAVGHGALPLSVLEARMRQAFPASK